MRKHVTAGIAALAIVTASPAMAREVTVEITNLTNAISYTPLLVVVHDRNFHMFEVGQLATANLRAMAEGGDIIGLTADAVSAGAAVVANPAAGVLAPGATTTAEFDLPARKQYLSLVAMLLPTNDGFVGLDAATIRPRNKKPQTFYLYGYDAGTEANNELINGGGAPGVLGIPGDPSGLGGTGGSGVTTDPDHNTTVHIHRGILGDDDPTGGISDLNRAAHRWHNAVARVVVYTGN